MIDIDRSSGIPIHKQVSDAIRFRIGNGHFRVGDVLPPTRTLANQLDISFHTVRKAYSELVREGIARSKKGSGYVVIETEPLSKSERMERGASVLSAALQNVVGLGLDEEEIEYLFSEQMELMGASEVQTKIVVAAAYRELAQACAIQLASAFQRECHSCTLNELEQHADADVVLVPFKYVRQALSSNAQSDILGVSFELDEEALAAVARLMDHETLGLVCRYSDAIGSLTNDLRAATKFSGQVVAVSVENGDAFLSNMVRECDLLLYTESAARSVRPFLERVSHHAKLGLALAASSIERVRRATP